MAQTRNIERLRQCYDLYSLETAKANGLNPEASLNHLLTVLPERFAADPKAKVDDLMPLIEKTQEAFGDSTVEH